MPFLNSIVARIDTDTATLLDDLVYRGRDDTFTIRAGRTTDFASVPRALTWLVPKMGAWTKACVLHDDLCDRLESGDGRLTAVDVDGILRRVLREEGVSVVLRWLIWDGVRIGALFTAARRPGWWSWPAGPLVLGISLLALPVVAPATVLVLLTLAVDRLVEALT